jgi:hypothetical protein
MEKSSVLVVGKEEFMIFAYGKRVKWAAIKT